MHSVTVAARRATTQKNVLRKEKDPRINGHAVPYKYGPRSRPRTDPGPYVVRTTTNQIRFTESCKTQGFPRFPVASSKLAN
jgi:hypothetical protein